jgi:ATP-dependent Clp protease adaptor protein ClpS
MLKRVRSLVGRIFSFGPSLEVIQDRLYADERACAVSILSAEVVQTTYKTLGTDPEIIKNRLSNLRNGATSPGADQVLNTGSLWHQHMVNLENPVQLELCQLIGLLVHGNVEIKDALTPPLGMPGDIPFFVAHKQLEAELRAMWPTLGEQTGNVLLLNDPFSPMEVVVNALEISFGMNRESAITKMLEVHKSGTSVLEISPSPSASDTCIRLNAEWRSLGLPLYCAPQRMPTPVPGVQ